MRTDWMSVRRADQLAMANRWFEVLSTRKIFGYGMRTLCACAVMCTLAFGITGCPNGDDNGGGGGSVTIYTAGTYVDSNGYERACYWAGTARTALPIPPEFDSSWANSITVVNNTVYTAGIYVATGIDWYNVDSRACYWAGTARTDLPVPTGVLSSQAHAITVINNTVHTAGRYVNNNENTQRACYWRGTERIDLSVPEEDSQAYGITVANNTVYTAGGYRGNACYWDGTTRTDLPVPAGTLFSEAYAITVVNDTAYIAGGYWDSNYNSRACYWIGTEWVDLPPAEDSGSWTGAITVVNNTVYTVGSYRDSNENIQRACYWRGTEITVLPVPAGAFFSEAYAITVVNNTVYTAGRYEDSDYNSRACYWIGTERTNLPDGSWANEIAVVAK